MCCEAWGPQNTDAGDTAVDHHRVQPCESTGRESDRKQHMGKIQDSSFFLRLEVICKWHKGSCQEDGIFYTKPSLWLTGLCLLVTACKKNKVGGPTLPTFVAYCDAAVIRTVCVAVWREQKRRSVGQNSKPRNRSPQLEQVVL